MNNEWWKEIVGYEGYYEVSNLGRIRGVDRVVDWNGTRRNINGKMVNQTTTEDGYKKARLSRNGVRKEYFVHRLVYEAFIGMIGDCMEINHKDFDRANNCVENLEMVTHLQNIEYTVRANRHYASSDLSGSNNPNYGNRKLSTRYANDKALCLQKQSRPGRANGRCVPIAIVDECGDRTNFDYIQECAIYIKNKRNLKVTISTIALKISRSLKNGAMCYGYHIERI